MAQALRGTREPKRPPEGPKLRTATTPHPAAPECPRESGSNEHSPSRRHGPREGDDVAGGQNEGVSLPRAAWLVTVAGFVIAALLLLANGYLGYFLVLLSVAFAAGVNLLR